MAFDLLPTKHSYIENYKIDVVCILLALVLPLCCSITIYAFLLQQQSDSQEKIQAYREEQQSLQAIHLSDDSIQAAAANLHALKQFWQLLDDAINQSVCLSDMHDSKNKITLVGYAQSAQHLQIFADKLSHSPLFKKVSIGKLLKTKNPHTLEFNIHLDTQVR